MLKKRLGIECIERDWSWHFKRLKDYYKLPSTLIIPEGCKEIGYYAFCGCEELRDVIIPGSVKEIAREAFFGCINLEKVSIPGSVERIGYASFDGCRRLKKVNIPRSVKKLEHYAFWGCRKATIILKKPRSKFEFFGDDVFKGCKDVKYAKEKTRN